MSFLHFLFDSSLDFLFPRECLSCGKRGESWCDVCVSSTPIDPSYVCPGCFQSSAEGQRHEECRRRSPLEGLVTALDWSNRSVRDAVHSFKYDGVRSLAKPFALLLLRKIQQSPLLFQFLGTADAIVPVPLHAKKWLWRTYNQSECIAHALVPFVPGEVRADLVRKQKHSQSQTKLEGAKRLRNVRGTFEIIPGTDVRGGRFVVLDDVVTSGATMNEIARVLKEGGASTVWGLAVTRG